MDTDELDDTSLATMTAVDESPRLSRHRDQRMPLLVGLADAAAIRRSSDGTISMGHINDDGSVDSEAVDLEALAAKRTAGGGMLDSIANMANSILGAGRFAALLYHSYTHAQCDRYNWCVSIWRLRCSAFDLYTRSSVCPTPSRILHWPDPFGRIMWGDRLDDPVDSGQR